MKEKFSGKVVEVKEKKSGEILLVIVSDPKITETKTKRVTVRFHTKNKSYLDFIGAKAIIITDNDSVRFTLEKERK